MKKKGWLALAIAVPLVITAMVWWLLSNPPKNHLDESGTISTDETAPATTTTAPADPDVPAGTLFFTGRVLEVEEDSALMKCLDSDRFDTVWVHLPEGVTPQVGEQYVVYHENLAMPSLPPRVAAIRMEKQ